MATATDTAAAQAAAQQQAALISARNLANSRALAYGRKQEVVMPPQIGSGPGQTYSLGTVLVYNLPSVNGSFIEDIVLYFSVVVNLAAGTGATYGLNPSAPFSLISTCELYYGQSQFKLPLYILRTWYQLQGAAYPTIGQAIVNQDNAVQALLYNSPFGVSTGNNTWTFYCTVPMRWLTRNVAGMLPIMGPATTGQLRLTVPAGLLGADPALFPIRATGGSGNAVTITSGSIIAYARYRDGMNFLTPALAYPPKDLDKLTTLQAQYDSTLQPLVAGVRNAIRVTTKERHWYLLSVIIDAQLSTAYSSWANLAAIELDQDYSGKNKFYAYGTTSINLPLYLWNLREREMLQSDLVDEGVIPWISGLIENTVDPTQRDGSMVLDMTPNHWGDATVGIVPTALNGTAGITARIDNYVFFENLRGLVKRG